MIIDEIIKDIIRCENVLEKNNYLDMIITIEELQDKYRNKIKLIEETFNDVVWNYTKNDLIKIKSILEKYKEELMLKEKLNKIHEKLSEIKFYISKHKIENKDNLIIIINIIEQVNNKDIGLDEKYEELKVCLDLIKSFDRKIAIHILNLINLVIT